MKRLRIITAVSLAVTIVAISVAAYNLVGLYRAEKNRTMEAVRESASNACILELISRMKSGEDAAQSFIRLNHFVESAQQKDGRLSNSDTLKTSLASLLRIGLEVADGRESVDRTALDSIFGQELHRHGLSPQKAFILPEESPAEVNGPLWSVTLKTPKVRAYITPMPGEVLSRMLGIIIPFTVVVCVFMFLSFYLIRTVTQLRTIEQMKDDFTRNMTHELKTPVAAAYSAADSLLRYYDPTDEARNRQFLGIILQRLGFLSGMIEKILSVSMERFRTIRLSKESVNLRELVEDVAGMIRLRTDKPLELTVDIPEDLRIQADPLHLGNVVTNLLDNAVKYSGESVDIRLTADSDTLTVEDNGIGIDKGNLPYIFDRFYRAPTGDRHDVGGYGLGLFYVRQIVTQSGWDISVSSRKGSGTRFVIKFK